MASHCLPFSFAIMFIVYSLNYLLVVIFIAIAIEESNPDMQNSIDIIVLLFLLYSNCYFRQTKC